MRRRYERAVALWGEGIVGYVFDTTQPENVFDDEGGRWVAACAVHDACINTTTLRDALLLAETREFCEDCEALR